MNTYLLTAMSGLLLTYPTVDPAWFRAPARVTIMASAVASSGTTRGWMVRVDVTPATGIHVYAPGNDGYIPVSVSLKVPAGLRSGQPTYPAGEPYVFGETKEVVQVYQHPFRITQSISVGRAGTFKSPAALAGELRYQACTDKVCFPPQTEPFTVTLPTTSQSGNSKRPNESS
jgi:DsbC/DsbD-like thiol-disulfide interchange protein